MAVTAKFVCEFVQDFGQQKNVALRPVTSGSEENKNFSAYTPNGRLELTIDKSTPAADYFTPRAEYYLTIDAVNTVGAEELAGPA